MLTNLGVQMYQLDFEEFLWANNVGEEFISHARECFETKIPMNEALHRQMMDYFKLYLLVGGLPDAVNTFIETRNIVQVRDAQKGINLGTVYELAVCSELSAHGFPLFYYDNKKKGEVEFLVNDYDSLTVVPIEVKSGKDYDQHASLDHFVETPDYNIKKGYVLCNEREILQEGAITYLPIYFVMFLVPSTPPDKVIVDIS